MKRDTILINDQEYWIEFNWDAVTDFLETENLELMDIDNLQKLNPKKITSLFYSGVKAGATLQGVPFDFDREQFSSILNIKDATNLLIIYARHSQAESKVSKKPEKKKKSRFSIFLSNIFYR